MKSAAAVLIVILTMFSALSVVDLSSADDYETFEDDYFRYHIVSATEVEIIEFDEDYPNEVLDIPSVANDGTTDYTVIGLSAQLYSDDLTRVNIPSSIRSITDGCFSMDLLNWIEVDPGNTHYASDAGVLFAKKDSVLTKLVRYPSAMEGDEYSIPAIYSSIPTNVSEIATSAFSASKLRIIELNDGIIKIGAGAFYNCESLEIIRSSQGDNVLPSSVSNIGSSAFSNCVKLSSLTLSDNLEYIGALAFNNSGITNVNVPMLVDFIGEGAFSDCTSLEGFTSDNFTYIAENGILYKLGKNDTRSLFAYPCAKADMTEYVIPDDVVDIDSYAFSGCSKLKTVVLNDSIVNIPDTAFFGCKSLEAIDLTNVVTTGVASFSGCENLKSLGLGKNLLTIGDASFYNCGIETLVIPSNVRFIGSDAFGGCANLRNVTIEEGSKVTISSDAFISDKNIEMITIASSDVVLEDGSLSISMLEDPFTLNVEVVKGYGVPSTAANEYTNLNITVIGERPYPWENWIGVFFCALVVIGILWAVREV